MDADTAKELVYHTLPIMAKSLGLIEWDITVVYVSLGEDGYGTCTPQPGQRTAVIEINADTHDDDAQLDKTLRHELIHCLLSPLEIYRKAVGQVARDTEMNLLDVSFSHAIESVVSNIEQALAPPTKKKEADRAE